jgi:DNA gyrase subunit B
MTTPTRTVAVTRDDEHNVFALQIEDRSQGYPRRSEIGVQFIASGEYRTLLSAFREIQDIKFPVIATMAGTPKEEEPAEEAAATVDGEAPAGDGQPQTRTRKDPDTKLENLDQFIEFFISAGKKGIAVNRYKGLGEMNPDTLWTTTMDPENRTLLQVRAEDHAEADQMFTTLMGDQVEPRRKFIEDNALDVKNLDV